MKFRFIILISGVLLIFSSLIFNIYELQIKKGKFYSLRAEAQFRLTGYLEPRRGTIYFTDKNGNAIPGAINKEYPVVFAVPKQVENLDESVSVLSQILVLPAGDLRGKLSKSNDAYELLATKITDEQATKIKEASIKGIYIDTQEFRFYPFGSLAAQVLGFVGPSDKDSEIKGRYGWEAFYDQYLRGSRGETQGEQIIEPVDGTDLTLTIDRDIQVQAEEILAKAITQNKATGGTIIVQEPASGKILALANNPPFDPKNHRL